MHLKLSVIALTALLAIAACGDDDDDEPADGSVKDAGGKPTEDSGADIDSGAGDAG